MMDSSYSTLAWYGVGAAAVSLSLLKLKTRLELSKAKHPSLSGHSRMSRRIAALIPYYEYDEHRFFRADSPPEEIAERRRTAFARLSELFRTRYPETVRLTAEAADSISDLQFTERYRVPFQFSRMVREHLRTGAFLKELSGVTVTDLDGNTLLRSDRLLRRERVRLRLLQALHRARRGTRARPRPGARRLSSGGGRQCPPAARDFRPRRSVVPHVGHRSGDAGGAARPLPHPAFASRAVLRRLSRLVGRRAARHRQSRCPRARPTRSTTCRRRPCASCAGATTSPACS